MTRTEARRRVALAALVAGAVAVAQDAHARIVTNGIQLNGFADDGAFPSGVSLDGIALSAGAGDKPTDSGNPKRGSGGDKPDDSGNPKRASGPDGVQTAAAGGAGGTSRTRTAPRSERPLPTAPPGLRGDLRQRSPAGPPKRSAGPSGRLHPGLSRIFHARPHGRLAPRARPTRRGRRTAAREERKHDQDRSCRRVALAALLAGTMAAAHEARAGFRIVTNGNSLHGMLNGTDPHGVGPDAAAPARAADPSRLRLRAARPAGG